MATSKLYSNLRVNAWLWRIFIVSYLLGALAILYSNITYRIIDVSCAYQRAWLSQGISIVGLAACGAVSALMFLWHAARWVHERQWKKLVTGSILIALLLVANADILGIAVTRCLFYGVNFSDVDLSGFYAR